MGFFGTTIERLAGLIGYVRAKPDEVIRFDRRSELFAVNELLYSGEVYAPRSAGGALYNVLKTYIGDAYCDEVRYRILPSFMPFRPIVDAYQNCLPGTWGPDGIKIADEFEGKPVNPKLAEPIGKIWRASNWDTEKALLFRWAANFGTVGMRISATTAVDDKPARVALGVDHPSRLFNFEEDAEGNVTAVCLKYTKQVNRNTLSDPDWESVEVVEELTKEEFSVKFDDDEQLKDGERRNGLGFCPYVILRHKNNGTAYGDWAYRGAEGPVHRINWRISRQDKSINRHQFPNWFGAAGGGSPESIDFGDDNKLTYVQTREGTPPPILQAIVPQIDQMEARAFWQDLRDLLRNTQPEMNLNDVKLLGNVSGEALAQVLKPTEQAILAVRPAYHHAVIRALQMGVSAGVVIGAWDVGTGMGGVVNSDKAYRTGLEGFEFAPQAAIPETPQQRVTNATADQADKTAKLTAAGLAANLQGLSEEEVLRVAGYTKKQIEDMKTETMTANSGVTLPDGVDTLSGDNAFNP